MSKEEEPKNKLNVVVKRINEKIAHAEAYGQRLELAIKRGDPSLGFTAPETALAAFGSCILSNLNKGAAALGLQVYDARIEFDVVKRFEPLGFEAVEYRLIVKSPEPDEKLKTLFERATTDGTATNALLEGLKPEKYLEILRS